ncbi:MAG: N-acetylglucosamine-6-phosphate deacetylase [Sphaerochaetaceae bacterium]|nr:N-acetylglucosamine-6-phosphate deacetylase [Sphaerochaetaceae bacterium]
MKADLVLYNGKVLAETLVIENGYVVIKNETIVRVGEGSCPKDISAKSMIDVEGKIISPGLIDMHTHGIMDVDFMSATYEEIVRALQEYAKYGVTRLVPTTLSNPIENIIRQHKLIRKVKETSPFGAMIIGTHMEGPWLAERCRGGHDAIYLQDPKPEVVDHFLTEVGDILASVTYAPELPNSVYLTEQLSLRGVVPIFGHTEASYEDAQASILAGARHVTHMYDTTLGYKENPDEALVMMPGMETAVLMDDRVSIELIGCPVHVLKPFFKFIEKVKPRNKTVVVTDSLVGTGMPEQTVLTYEDGHKVYVEDGVLRMINDDPAINGNLTGSAVTLNIALKRLREYAEIPLARAVEWVSLNPATTLGVEKSTGSIKVGKFADITVMDDDCDIYLTIVKGEPIHDTLTRRKS